MSEPLQRTKIAALVVSGSMIITLAISEGYKSVAYRDTGNVYTIGFGETKGIKQGDTTTPQRALVVLKKSVDGYASGVKSCLTQPLFQYEFDAITDFAYNAGVGAACKSPMVKKFNQQDYAGACLAFKNYYVHDRQGNLIKGLVNRREKEHQTCIGNNQ